MLLLRFRIGGDWYGLDSRQVREVIPHVPLRVCPGAPAYVAGLFNYRGQVVPVVDLCRLMGGAPPTPRLSTRIMIVTYTGQQGVPRTLGLLAEAVTSTLEAKTEDFLQGRLTPEGAPYLDRVAVHGGQMIQCMQVEGLLPSDVERRLFAEVAQA